MIIIHCPRGTVRKIVKELWGYGLKPIKVSYVRGFVVVDEADYSVIEDYINELKEAGVSIRISKQRGLAYFISQRKIERVEKKERPLEEFLEK